MRCGMLFPPQNNQQLGPRMPQEPGSGDFGMAGKTKRDHPFRIADARSTMMNRHRPLATFRRRAAGNAASVSIPRENFLAMTAEVLFVLPPQGVAGGAKTESEDLIPAARTTDRALEQTSHSHHPICRVMEDLGIDHPPKE